MRITAASANNSSSNKDARRRDGLPRFRKVLSTVIVAVFVYTSVGWLGSGHGSVSGYPTATTSTSTSTSTSTHNEATSRTIQKESVVLLPERLIIDNTQIFLQLPNNQAPQGIVLLFHGCQHGGMDWFQLPEEQRIVKFLLAQGHAVVAFSSQQRTGSRCWSNVFPATTNPDVQHITNAFPKILQTKFHGDTTSLPLYAIGASSGGTFITILSQKLSFAGLEVMISPGHAGAIKWMAEQKQIKTKAAPPRIAFVYMPKDTTSAGTQQIARRQELLRDCCQVATYKSHPQPVTGKWLSDRIDNLSLDQANTLVNQLVDVAVLDEETHFLVQDSRSAWNSQIKKLASKLGLGGLTLPSLQELFNLADGGHELTSEHIAEVFAFWKQT
jgi:hypothetical protein